MACFSSSRNRSKPVHHRPPRAVLRQTRPMLVFGLLRIAPHVRFDERRYFSVFLFAKHTLVAEIFVADKRAFPIAMIATRLEPPRSDCNDRSDPEGHEEPEQHGTDQKRLHWKQPRLLRVVARKKMLCVRTVYERQRGTALRPHYGRRLRAGSRKIPPLFAGSTGCGNGKDGNLKKGLIFLLVTKKRDFPRRMADFPRYGATLTSTLSANPVQPPATWTRDRLGGRVGGRARHPDATPDPGRGRR